MKVFKFAVLAFGMLLFAHGATYAQTQPAPTQAAPTVHAPFSDLKGIGAGLVIVARPWESATWPRARSTAWPANPRSPATSRRR